MISGTLVSDRLIEVRLLQVWLRSDLYETIHPSLDLIFLC